MVDGFYFSRKKLSKVLLEQINDIDFYPREDFEEGYDARLTGRVRAGLACNLCVLFSDEIKGNGYALEDINWEAHKTTKGDYMNLHSDTHEPGSIQILLWVVNGELKGRDFHYGTLDGIYHKTIMTGLTCVMDIENPNYLHGFSMQTGGEVITITGTPRN